MQFHEADYGIVCDEEKEHGQCLAAWCAWQRGRSTTTEALIRSVAESYSSARVQVRVDPPAYYFEVKLPDVGGMPEYLEDLMRVVWEIQPAHLGTGHRVPVNTLGCLFMASRTSWRYRQRMLLQKAAPPKIRKAVYRCGCMHLRYTQRLKGVESTD